MKNYTMIDGKSWKIGDITVQVILELNLDVPWHIFYPNDRFDQKVFDKYKPDFVYEPKMFRSNDQTYLIKTPDKNILIDSGDDMSGTYFENLKAAGVEPEDIDYIFFTHMHFDHVRRNCYIKNGSLEPIFPNARYMFGRKEFEYWHDLYEKHANELGKFDDSTKSALDMVKVTENAKSEADAAVDANALDPVSAIHLEAYETHVKPLLRKGVVELFDDDYKLDDILEVVPTPGHSRGCNAFLVHSKGESILFSGDAIHQPIQLSEIDLCSIYDYDKEASTASRKVLFERFANTDTLVLGNHFVAPYGGFIVTDEETGAYKFAK